MYRTDKVSNSAVAIVKGDEIIMPRAVRPTSRPKPAPVLIAAK